MSNSPPKFENLNLKFIFQFLVHYRVIVVTPELTPYSEPVSLYIEDPNQNRIVDTPKIELKKGVHSGELTLSSEPPLGIWRIFVTTKSGQKFNKEFTVER